jgi:hypothetical protein
MKKFLKFIKEYYILGISGLFDTEFYLEKYPDVKKAKTNPLLHFIKNGWKEGRNPSCYFETKYYLGQNRDVLSGNINPLLHFIITGFHEGRSPSLYDTIANYMKSEKTEEIPKRSCLKSALLTNKTNAEIKQKIVKSANIERTNFSLADRKVFNQYQPELRNWDGNEMKIVQIDGKHWVIKTQIHVSNLQRELLVFSLAKGIVNAAEVRTLNDQDIHDLQVLGLLNHLASPFNTLLVRLAQEYRKEELPLREFDTAMAGEFVFSLWVRRRDSGKWNRAFSIDGLPVFYDYHASLNFEPWLYDVDSFFSKTQPGHAGTWRILEAKEHQLTTDFSRKQNQGINFIKNKKDFNKALDFMTSKIMLENFDFIRLIKQAGFMGNAIDEIQNHLITAQINLPGDVKKLKNVIFPST